ncbi:MAG: alpha/beta hydrolase domain-containing protein [Polyangiales bacterium]
MDHRAFGPLPWSFAMAIALTLVTGSARAIGGASGRSRVAAPTVIGPIPARAKPGQASHDYPFLTPKEDLSAHGYVEEEFFLDGVASRYDTSPRGSGAVLSSGHPYRTRIVVRRPTSTKTFNGTVLLEWQNVGAGYDMDAHWGPSWEHFVRKGYAWVGVSAQRAGVHGGASTHEALVQNDGLRAWSPGRYGSLDLTAGGAVLDDSLGFDVFAQTARALRWPGAKDALGGLRAKLVIAMGTGQAANRLALYHNHLHAQHGVIDGYYLLSGGQALRTDLDVKVFQFLSESDLRGGPARGQPDSDTFRSWEIAGSAQVGYESEQYRAGLLARDFPGRADSAHCDEPPFSRVRAHYVINAQYDALVRWVSKGIAPPSAPRIVFTDGDAPTIARDALGIARGGIRLPEVEVPTALNSGANTGTSSCALYGMHRPFAPSTLQRMYPTHADYARAVAQVAQRASRAGYISNGAAWEMAVDAAMSDVPFR